MQSNIIHFIQTVRLFGSVVSFLATDNQSQPKAEQQERRRVTAPLFQICLLAMVEDYMITVRTVWLCIVIYRTFGSFHFGGARCVYY